MSISNGEKLPMLVALCYEQVKRFRVKQFITKPHGLLVFSLLKITMQLQIVYSQLEDQQVARPEKSSFRNQTYFFVLTSQRPFHSHCSISAFSVC